MFEVGNELTNGINDLGNKAELDRIGYYTTNAAGEKVLDYRVLKRHLIWAHNTCGKAVCNDPTPWM